MARACLWLAIALVVCLPSPADAAALPGRESARMIERVNRLRAGNGLLPLTPSIELTRSAGRYAAWMLETDHLSHSATIQAPRRFRRLGETLAWHFGWSPSGSVTLMRWRRSPTHRDALLNPAFDYIGAAFRRGSVAGVRATAWVAHLGG